MTQFEYAAITKILTNGAPALADELLTAINDLIKSEQTLTKMLNKQKSANESKETK